MYVYMCWSPQSGKTCVSPRESSPITSDPPHPTPFSPPAPLIPSKLYIRKMPYFLYVCIQCISTRHLFFSFFIFFFALFVLALFALASALFSAAAAPFMMPFSSSPLWLLLLCVFRPHRCGGGGRPTLVCSHQVLMPYPPTPCCFPILSIREDIRKKKAIVAPVAPWRGLNRLHKPIDGALGGRSNSLCSLASLASAGLLYQYTQYSPIESHLCSVQSWVERVGHA
jgi:hypothetical protein